MLGNINNKNLLIPLFLLFVFLIFLIFMQRGDILPPKPFSNSKNGIQLKILTFNLWYNGDKVENGIEKIAKHIKFINPDIAALQEVLTPEHYEKLMKALGPEWNGVFINIEYPNTAIVSRHKIDKTSITNTTRAATIGANITLANKNKTISFWSIHLFEHPFGPYLAADPTNTRLDQIILGDYETTPSGRILDVMEMLNTTNFKNALNNDIPLIVAGDFNTPSHLDWIESTKDLHNNWIIQWPATHILESVVGLKDSFRELFPDPLKNPGNTWTCVNSSEPQDRIDFIMYKSSKLIPFKSYIYSGNEPITQSPNYTLNDYPSDHFSVITEFYFNYD